MKLLELTIHNIRGIVDMTLSMGGENYLIWGGNGAGKSGAVDAIDFLLTGNISRLRGEGTDELSEKEHGPHINSDPSDAWVRGTIELADNSRFQVYRSIDKASKPIITPTPPSSLELIFKFLEKRPSLLTRKDILRYIAAKAGSRSSAVQAVGLAPN